MIDGVTIHSIFNVAVQHGKIPKYTDMNPAALDQARAILKDLKCVIVDEISMVSNILLFYMHLRLKDIFTPEDDASLFGDKSMVLFGDLLQLPPVEANPPFMTVTGDEM